MSHIELTINGMTCTGCSSRLQRVLQATDGIRTASVALETKQASIDYDPAEIGLDAIRSVITDAGFSIDGDGVKAK